MGTALCVKCGYDLRAADHGADPASSWICPECGTAMSVAQLEGTRRRAALASFLTPAFIVLVGVVMCWSVSDPDGTPWIQIRQVTESAVGEIDIGRQAFKAIMMLAPVLWIMLSLAALWIGTKLLRAAGWRKRARAMSVLGIVFIVLGAFCWELYALLAIAMSHYQP
jgi:hypothetical protein